MTNRLSKQDVKRLAALSALEFDDEELEFFTREFESISAFVEQIVDAEISQVAIEERELTINQLREDLPHESLSQTEILKNSPKTKSGQFCVPKMLE